MKKVYRQDGSAVDLPDDEAEKLVRKKIVSYENPKPQKAAPVKPAQGEVK